MYSGRMAKQRGSSPFPVWGPDNVERAAATGVLTSDALSFPTHAVAVEDVVQPDLDQALDEMPDITDEPPAKPAPAKKPAAKKAATPRKKAAAK